MIIDTLKSNRYIYTPMDESLIRRIEELGLSNKEARIYVSTLMLGPSSVQQIADHSGIKRVTAYVILESLAALGLVSQSIKAKKTLFVAESPENLSRLLDNREKSIHEQRDQLKEILPELLSLKDLPVDAPVVKFYEGIESIRSINQTYFELMKKEGVTETFGISDLDELRRVFPDIEDKGANPSRVKAKMKSRFLYTSRRGPIMAKTDKLVGRQSRYLPRDKFHFLSDISFAGDYTFLITLASDRPVGVVIKSNAITNGLKQVFNLAWEAAEKYNK